MSSVSSVVILGLNGRRHTLKVTPNTFIRQVLEEACAKYGVNPDDYDLKRGNKALDVSLSFRFANIPNNAMLELHPSDKIRKECNVTVGIQLESGERLTGEFSPSSSMWDVISHCLCQRNGSSNHGDDGSSVPVCVYMRQMISGEELKNRTLRSLGLTRGSAMFRLLYRKADQLQEQAHVSSPLTKSTTESTSISESSENSKCCETADRVKLSLGKEEETINASTEKCQMSSSTPRNDGTSFSSASQAWSTEPRSFSSSERSLETSPDLAVHENVNFTGSSCGSSIQRDELVCSNINLEEKCSPENLMDVDSVSEDHANTGTEVETGTVTIIGEKNAVLFNLDDVSSMPKMDLPEDFYEITIEDVKYLFQEYKRARLEAENRPLELQSQKQNANLQRLAQYAQTVVRIQFADRLVLQGVFSIEDTVKSVMDFVRGFLENEELNFYLYTSPPKTNLLPEKTLLECRLFPAAVVYFGCETYLDSYLKPTYRSQLSDPGAANKAAAEFRQKHISTIPSSMPNIHIDVNVNVEVNSQQNLDVPSTSNSHIPTRTDHSDEKMPKWLKLSKK